MHDKTILISGAGSLAQAFSKFVLRNFQPTKIILFCRSEKDLSAARKAIPDPKRKMRFFLGDACNVPPWRFQDVEYLIHTAALKEVANGEYNPIEMTRVNVDGTLNMIEVCQQLPKLEKAIFISTDKAVMPVNLYGGTKLVGEKVWLDANFYKPVFMVVRYGNVMGSRGSVLSLWKDQIEAGAKELNITDLKMTRFWFTMEQAVSLVLEALQNGKSGWTYVGRSKAFRLEILAKALYKQVKLNVIGRQPGEKLHETLLHSENEYQRAVSRPDHYLVVPEHEYIERGPEPGNTVSAPVTSEIAAVTTKSNEVMLFREIRQALDIDKSKKGERDRIRKRAE